MRDAYLWVALLLATSEFTETKETTQGKRNLDQCPKFEADLVIGGPIGEYIKYGGSVGLLFHNLDALFIVCKKKLFFSGSFETRSANVYRIVIGILLFRS
eukprot:GHVR01035768.1.p1 GENE.GHVR01035768.1~~GHVR01035768.1.p1  ORF type:complete len:100 (-),score=10.35 GHVR01035768.1:400-699(-)